MRTYNKTTVSKLVARFDTELKNILMSDLKAIKAAKNEILNSVTVGLQQDSLSAA
jgi:hypothetical protein